MQRRPAPELQTTLNKCYGRSLDEVGDFGPLTKSALIYAQKKAFPNDSSQWDGIYGPNTRKGILHEATTSGCKRVNWLAEIVQKGPSA